MQFFPRAPCLKCKDAQSCRGSLRRLKRLGKFCGVAMKIGNFDQIDLSRCNKPLMVLHETNVLDLFALPRTSNSIISTCFFLYFRLRRIRPASTFISECLQPIKRYNAALRLSSHPQMYTHTSLHHHQRGQADLSLKLNLSHVVSYTNFYDP
jgi:hypothetical protein